jgi:hypothetical protein
MIGHLIRNRAVPMGQKSRHQGADDAQQRPSTGSGPLEAGSQRRQFFLPADHLASGRARRLLSAVWETTFAAADGASTGSGAGNMIDHLRCRVPSAPHCQ